MVVHAPPLAHAVAAPVAAIDEAAAGGTKPVVVVLMGGAQRAAAAGLAGAGVRLPRAGGRRPRPLARLRHVAGARRPGRRPPASPTSTGPRPPAIIAGALDRGADAARHRRGRRRAGRLRRPHARDDPLARRATPSPPPTPSATRWPSRPSTATSVARCGPASPSTSATPTTSSTPWPSCRTPSAPTPTRSSSRRWSRPASTCASAARPTTGSARSWPSVSAARPPTSSATRRRGWRRCRRPAPTALLAGSRAGPALRAAPGWRRRRVIDTLMRVAQLVGGPPRDRAGRPQPDHRVAGRRADDRRDDRDQPPPDRSPGRCAGLNDCVDLTPGARRDRPPVPCCCATATPVSLADYREVDDGRTLVFHHTADPAAAPRQRATPAGSSAGRSTTCAASGRKVVATCWFVEEFIDQHPEYQDLVAS